MENFNYDEIGFEEFLRQLLDQEMITDPTEVGIVKFYLDNDYDALSDKQKYRFDEMLKRVVPLDAKGQRPDCTFCGNELSWFEVLEARDNDGNCCACRDELERIRSGK